MISGLPSPLVSLLAMGPNQTGLEYLGGAKAAGPVASLATPTFAARDVLMIFGNWGLLSAAAIPGLRFNGVSTATYWHRQFSAGDLAGQLTFANRQTPSATLAELWHLATVQPGSFLAVVSNRLATSKGLFFSPSLSTGSAAAVPVVVIGSGEMVNTTTQITSVAMTSAVATTFPAGSGLQVFGRNFP